MANNQYVNKVQMADGRTLMDISGDTVTPENMTSGATAHDRSGAPITGSMITHNVYDGLDSTSTDDALSANMGKKLSDSVVSLNDKLTALIKSKNITGTTDNDGFISLGLSDYQIPLYVTGPSQSKVIRLLCGTNSGAWGGFALCNVHNTSVTFRCWYLDFTN